MHPLSPLFLKNPIKFGVFFPLFFGCFLLILENNTARAQGSLITAVNNAKPSIVQVTARTKGIYKSPQAHAALAKNSGRILLLRRIKSVTHQRTGSGVILHEEGLVVTNAHTVQNADMVEVTLHDGQKIKGQLVHLVRHHDLAFIKISLPHPLTPVPIANSDELRLGDDVVTLGSSPLLNQTISGGKVIGIGRASGFPFKGPQKTKIIQTDITLYKGDSGGPLLDRQGRLVGLMVAGQKKRANSSFAIPSNQIYKDYKSFIQAQQETVNP